MPDKAVCLFVMDGFADWEPAHAIAELRRHGGFRVESLGLTSAAVRSMGGLHVVPSRTVAGVDPDDVAVTAVPEYAEAEHYVDLPAVRDRGLITASGLGDVEFARELFEEMNVLTPAERATWATMFRSARLP